jgi:thiamine-monophosphate kinase
MRYVLAGGDDYELCFTAPRKRHADVLEAGARARVAVRWVGHIVEASGVMQNPVTVVNQEGEPLDITGIGGFDHFHQ